MVVTRNLRKRIRRFAECDKTMNLISDEFVNTVAALIGEVTPSNCDAAEYRLGKAFDALPICLDLWSYMLLTAQGEVLWADLNDNNEPQEERRLSSPQEVLSALRVGVKRYQRLALLLPARPVDAVDCELCIGSGVMQTADAKPQEVCCLWCQGCGWTLSTWC